MLMSPSPLFTVAAPPGVNLALAARRHRPRHRGDHAAAPVTSSGAASTASSRRPALALCVVVVFVVIVTVAQHVSGGGSRYARYLLPALGVAAALFALGLDRLWPRVLPAVTVVLMGWWALRNVPSGVDPAAERRPRDRRQADARAAPGAPGQSVAAHRRRLS